MLVALDSNTSTVVIEEAETLNKLSARVVGPHRFDWLPAGLVADGDGEHLWASTIWLKEMATPRRDSEIWAADFEAMVSYAMRKGWANPDTGMVRIHIEPVSAANG
ncbi:MAG: frataxin family protein [Hyphomicrobiales bacterium]|nr:frataxin family protein [Hyphomicrobiales bacterium]